MGDVEVLRIAEATAEAEETMGEPPAGGPSSLESVRVT